MWRMASSSSTTRTRRWRSAGAGMAAARGYAPVYCPGARRVVPTVLQVVHGYPPREVAGTEVATARLAGSLRRRGWTCHVLAATRAPGTPQYALLEEPRVTRIVQNVP